MRVRKNTISDVRQALGLGKGTAGYRRLKNLVFSSGIPHIVQGRSILIPAEFAERIIGLKSYPLKGTIDPLYPFHRQAHSRYE